MDFSDAPKVVDLQKRLTGFMEEHIYPAEAVYHHEVAENRKAGNAWQPTKVMEELKTQAKAHLEGLGYEVETVVNDLSKFDQIPAMVDQVLARFGTIDILVNNAGATWGANAEDYPDAAWNKVMDLNVNAPFFLSREVGKRVMIPKGRATSSSRPRWPPSRARRPA